MEAPRILRADDIRLDLAAQELRVRGQSVPLRNKPFRLLQALMSRPGELLTKTELIEAGWGDQPVSDAVLTTAIKELRRALGDNPRKPRAIETAHGRGYRFMLEVEAGAPEDEPPREPGLAPAPPARGRWTRRPAVLLVALGVFILLGLFALQERTGGPLRGAGGELAGASIAVLPLDDLSPEGSRGWFADGLAEEILNLLAQTPGLEVASRTSSFRYRDATVDVREIGEALGVAHVLEGSVRTAEDQLRITVQLIRADNGLHVFSESWNRPLTSRNVFEVQREVASEVLRAINAGLSLPANPLPALDNIGLAAYEAFLQGRELLERRDASAVREAITRLREAVDRAPAYAPARALLGEALLHSQGLGELSPQQIMAAAQEQISAALELDPDSGQVLTAASLLAMARREPAAALAHAERAVARSPGLAQAHFRYGGALALMQRYGEAERAFRQATLLDPLSPLPRSAVVAVELGNGDAGEALEQARESLKWNPGDPVAKASLGLVLLSLGDYLEAQRMLQGVLGSDPQQGLSRYHLADLLWRLGLDDVLLNAAPSPPLAAARAAVWVARGDDGAASSELAAFPGPRLAGLNALDIAYWTGSQPEAAEAANEVLASLERGGEMAVMPMRDDWVQAMETLRSLEHPGAAVLEERLATLFRDWHGAGDELLAAQEAYLAAAWHQSTGRKERALAIVQAAAEQGLVLRELTLDPLFGPLRNDPGFRSALATMEKRAAELRPVVAQRYREFSGRVL